MSGTFVPFDEFEKDCQFPHKSSRVPCKGDSNSNTDGQSNGLSSFVGLVSGWVRPEDGAYPQMSALNNTQIRVPSGAGYIVHPVTGVLEVKWEQTDVAISGVFSRWITTIAVNADGNVVQLNGNVDPRWLREHIVLGTVTHIAGSIDGVNNTPSIWADISYAAYDLIMSQRNSRIKGGVTYPNIGKNLKLNLQERELFYYGGTPNQVVNPNVVHDAEQYSISYFCITGSSSVVTETSFLPVNQYNPGGSNEIRAATGSDGTSQIFRLYQLGRKFLMLYGQKLYPSLAHATAMATTEAFMLPEKLVNATLLSVIVVRIDATDLTDPDQSVIVTPDEGGGPGAAPGTPSDGISPLYWEWEGDGESIDFPIPGANVANILAYDTAMGIEESPESYLVLKPGVDFNILLGDHPDEAVIRILTGAPAEGVKGFTILRGYAKQVADGTPLTSTAPTIDDTINSDTTIDRRWQNNLLIINSADPVTITIRQNTGDVDLDWSNGEYFMVLQQGAGQVTIVQEDEGTVTPPTDFENKTRAQGSIISATCTAADADAWVTAGDLLRTAVEPSRQFFRLIDRSVLSATNITTGTGKDSFIAPFDLQLDAIADRGVVGNLGVAQASGAVFAFDVLVAGTSIFATKPTIDNAETSTLTAATPAVYSPAFLTANRIIPAGAEVRLDVTTVGTAMAKRLSCGLCGVRAG